MKNMRRMLVIVAVAVAGFVAGEVYAKSKSKEVNWAADQIQLKEIPNIKGISKADLWGNAEKGAHGTLTKFAAGTKVGLHTHTYELKLVVIAGTMVFNSEDGKETRLGPGSYRLEPAGLKHVTACAEGADCKFVEIQPGAFDVKMVEEKK